MAAQAINVKAGCKLDVANNIIYNACTNAFKLSNAGNSEVIPLSEMTAYNNTIVNCGWRRSKNKKGGSVWVEKAAKPIFVNNLIYDSRFGLKQPRRMVLIWSTAVLHQTTTLHLQRLA